MKCSLNYMKGDGGIMTDKEKLIELLKGVGNKSIFLPTDKFITYLADYLLENGVTVSCKTDVFKYYVVRNKTTGEYYRGKGVNKWGEYYNQASIYRIKKHAECTAEDESKRGIDTEVVEIRILEVERNK